MHLWDLQTGTYPWLTDPEVEELPFASIKNLAVDYLLSDYLDDTATVELAGLVHVEAAWDSSNPLGESKWLAKTLAGFEKAYSIIVAGNLLNADFPELLAAHRQTSNHVVGVRQILNYHVDSKYTFTDNPEIIFDKTWRKNFAHLGDQAMIFDLQIFPDQASDLAALASEFSQTKMVINHFIMPLKWDRDGIADWKAELAKLAKHENIAVKLSGLYMYHRNWPKEAMNTLIDTALELFTPARVMWGSNFPVDRQFVTLEKLVNDFESSLARHDLATREAVMWKSANSWYGLGVN
ncbi:COG3618 Predicted metal-dependent hydrolase of the TIM-barrel fold [Candidatus Nanopelagicaceae bacterium]